MGPAIRSQSATARRHPQARQWTGHGLNMNASRKDVPWPIFFEADFAH
jgi:hypothetical protein